MIGDKKGKERFDAEKRLSEYQGDDRIVSSEEMAKELEATKDSVFKIATGIPTLDRLHEGGFEQGEVVIFTGPTGEGKTTALMSITRNMAMRKVRSVWFTLEVTPRQFIEKISNDGGLPPLFYLPHKNVDQPEIEWLEERIVEAKVKYDTQVVFIDHLHHIFSLSKTQKNNNLSWEIGDMMAKICQLAINHNVIIFLIAHTKDDPAGSMREPRMQDIRDSGLISRLAHSIVGVWRVRNQDELEATRMPVVGEEDTKSKLRVFKNRRVGKKGTWFMFHEKHYLEEVTTGQHGDNF